MSKHYFPKVGDQIYFRLYNTPEKKFYGEVCKGEIIAKNEDKTYVIKDLLYSFQIDNLARKEIKGKIH
jgi:predicted RNA-binding protein (virulence factor B family)